MKFKNYIETESGIKDTSTSPGTAGQVLSSTVTGTSWIDQDTLVSAASKLVVIACKNTSGSTINKGTPVYQTGTVGATDVIEVAPADATISTGYLPAIGILQTTLINNNDPVTDPGNVVITGEFLNYSTSGIPTNNPGGVPITGDTVYLAAGGGLTCIKPTGAGNAIQNLGLIGKVSGGNAGSITVSSIMRANDVPNLPTGRIWVGDGNTIVSDTVYVDEPNGRVGIGTDDPATPLHVYGTIDGEPTTMLVENGDTTITLGQLVANLEFRANDASVNGVGVMGQLAMVAENAGSVYGMGLYTKDGTPGVNEVMRLSGDGNVGIGTTTPGTYKLAVAGSTNIGGDVEVSDGLGGDKVLTLNANIGHFSIGDIDGLGDQAFISGDSSSISISTNQITTLHCDSNNRVGIGETNPTQKLHVDGNARLTGLFYDGTNSGGTNGQILSSDGGQTEWIDGSAIPGVPAGSGTTNYLARWTPDANTLGIGVTYDNGTSVGIGTTDPGAKLEVVGTTGVIIDSGSSNQAKLTLIGDAGSYGGGGIIDVIGGSSDYITYDLNVKRSPNTMEASNRYWMGSAGWSWDGNIGATRVQPYTSYDFKSQGSSQMVIYNNNVGIGTTSPFERLTIKGTDRYIAAEQTNYTWGSSFTIGAKIGTDASAGLIDFRRWTGTGNTHNNGIITCGSNGKGMDFRVDTKTSNTAATTSRMHIALNGNVGIGTTSPGSQIGSTKILDISSNGNGEVILDHTDAGTTSDIGLYSWNRNNDHLAHIKATCDGATDAAFISFHTQATGGSFLNPSSNEKMRIESTGNVGIGTNIPTELLHISSTGPARLLIEADTDNVTETDNAQIILKQDGGAVVGRLGYRTNTNDLELLNEYTSNIYLGTSNSIRATLHANGNFGIGNSTPQAKLHVSNGLLRTWSPSSGTSAIFESTVSNRNFVTLTAANEAELWFGNAATQAKGRVRYEMANNNMEFWTNATQKMVIDGSGDVGIGTTNPSQKLHVVGRVASTAGNGFQIINSYGSPLLGDFYGSFTTTSPLYVGGPYSGQACYASAFNITSDYRLKENEAPLTEASSRIKKLKPIRFNYISSENTVDGFLAHEVAEVIPEAVTGEKDAVREDGSDELQGLDLSKIVPLLTAALQESITKIEQLEQRIQTLENK